MHENVKDLAAKAETMPEQADQIEKLDAQLDTKWRELSVSNYTDRLGIQLLMISMSFAKSILLELRNLFLIE